MTETQKFFLSFNSADKDKAEWVAWVLKEAGHEVAFHAWEVGAGEDIPHWMNEKLAWADRLIAIISPAYINATYSVQEWQAQAWDDPDGKQGAVVPIVVSHTPKIPPLLRTRKRIDLTGIDETAAELRLLNEIRMPSVPTHKPSFQFEPSNHREDNEKHSEAIPDTKPEFLEESVGPDPDVTHDQPIIRSESGDVLSVFFQHLGPIPTWLFMFSLGVAFLIIAGWDPNQLWGKGIEKMPTPSEFWQGYAKYGYVNNVSISLSSVLVLPFLFKHMVRAYRNLPSACGYIGGQTLIDEVGAALNQRWMTYAIYTIASVLIVFHLNSLVNDHTWTWKLSRAPCPDGCFFVSAFGSFSILGATTTAYLVLLTLFPIFLARSYLAGEIIVKELGSGRSELRLFDEDQFFGLKKLRDVTKDVYIVMALSCVYIILYIFDKSIVQDGWRDGNTVIIALIFVVMWVLFFSFVVTKIATPVRSLIRNCKSQEVRRLSALIERRQAADEPYDKLIASRREVKKDLEELPDGLVINWWAVVLLPIIVVLGAAAIIVVNQ